MLSVAWFFPQLLQLVLFFTELNYLTLSAPSPLTAFPRPRRHALSSPALSTGPATASLTFSCLFFPFSICSLCRCDVPAVAPQQFNPLLVQKLPCCFPTPQFLQKTANIRSLLVLSMSFMVLLPFYVPTQDLLFLLTAEDTVHLTQSPHRQPQPLTSICSPCPSPASWGWGFGPGFSIGVVDPTL